MNKKIIDTIGETLISYEDILNIHNMQKLSELLLDGKKYKKIIDTIIIIINKYNDVSYDVLNIFITHIIILYNPYKTIKNKDACLMDLEKIVDEYGEAIKIESLNIFLNTVMKYYEN
tara:strand:+ start:280 stop:630 length:351 start_codon:yes stop_codon:yes gene_type:complete